MITIVTCALVSLALTAYYAQREEHFSQRLFMNMLVGAGVGFFIAAMLRPYLPSSYQEMESFPLAVFSQNGEEKVMFKFDSRWVDFSVKKDSRIVPSTRLVDGERVSLVVENSDNPRVVNSRLVYDEKWYGWFALPLSSNDAITQIYVSEQILAQSS